MANVYHIVPGIRTILRTHSDRQHVEDSFRSQMLLLWQLLVEMLGLFLNLPEFKTVILGFCTVNFLCFGGNRVNIQGVSTDKATRNSAHKFWRNSQFSFLTCIILMHACVKFDLFQTARERKHIHAPVVKKIHRLESWQYAFLDHLLLRYLTDRIIILLLHCRSLKSLKSCLNILSLIKSFVYDAFH